jgi:formate--tetrahydrofolate ligase
MVCTVRALKAHSGRYRVAAGRALDRALADEDVAAVVEGGANLEKQIENVRIHGIPAVVAINRFPADTEREHDLIRKRAMGAGAFAAEVSEVFGKGGEGGRALASAVDAACEKGGGKFRFLYPLDAPVKEKIDTIARRMYGADGVDYAEEAEADIARYEKLGYGKMPICMAKTHLSLSADPEKKGRPTGWRLPIRQVRLSAGAGFLYPLCGEMKTMPGLGSRPGLENVDIDERGEIVGLF